MKRIIIVIAALSALMIGSKELIRAFGPPPGGTAAQTLRPFNADIDAPETTILRDSGGGETTLAAWRGQVAVVTLWATWCGVCAHEMPELDALARRWNGKGVAVLPVSIDQDPAPGIVAGWLKGRGFTALPALIDEGRSMAEAVSLRGTPTTFIIDKFGKVITAFEGLGPWGDEASDELLEALTKAESTEEARALLAGS